MKVKQYRKILLLVLMICAAILFGCVERALSSQLSTQQIASEWSAKESYAQVSCFFSKDAAVTEDYVVQIEQKLKTALAEASKTRQMKTEERWLTVTAHRGGLQFIQTGHRSRRVLSESEVIFSHFIR